MDDATFMKALGTLQFEDRLATCYPNGFFMTNTRSQAVQFNLQNINASPFQISVWESSDSLDKLFQFQPYSQSERRELSTMIVGNSKQSRLIAIRIDNTGRCSFPYVHTYDGMREEDNIKVPQITLDSTVKHFKLRIDRGPDLAYFLEQDLFKTAGYARNPIRYTRLTEIYNDQKTRRFEHSHTDGMPVNSSWYLTNYTPLL